VKAPEFAPSQLKDTKAWEYIVRFVFGGAITVATGIIGKVWGPLVAGLFLAFPAILPASLTLVKQHDGRKQAVEDARGARLGSIALVAFAGVVLATVGRIPPFAVLLLASVTWLLVSVGAWLALHGKDHGDAD
jgi:Protein of unknown function (DUF3147)